MPPQPAPPRPAAALQAGRAGQTLFISDLHLSPQQPELTATFLHWLSARASGTAALYILGDLFDAWIGDDDDGYGDVEAALAGVAASGTRGYLMHGNRDFLLGRRFARRTGFRLLPDPARITLAGEPVLLMHGDLLCTDDVPYQRFRRRVRNPVVQWLFLRKSLRRRRRIAADYRQKSAQAMADKTAAIMDVNAGTVVDYLRRHRVQRMIHGHTHRPADHQLTVDGIPALRHVLADWSSAGGEVLVETGGALVREPVPPLEADATAV